MEFPPGRSFPRRPGLSSHLAGYPCPSPLSACTVGWPCRLALLTSLTGWPCQVAVSDSPGCLQCGQPVGQPIGEPCRLALPPCGAAMPCREAGSPPLVGLPVRPPLTEGRQGWLRRPALAASYAC